MSDADFSDYYKQLDPVSQARYRAKLTLHEGSVHHPDPYAILEAYWINNVSKWPTVQFGDLYNYLVNTPGIYTKESLKAYKSLEGYNFFVCGHVQACFYCGIHADSKECFIKAKVTPSQKVGEKPHVPWVMLNKKDGYVVTAHCNCKAG